MDANGVYLTKTSSIELLTDQDEGRDSKQTDGCKRHCKSGLKHDFTVLTPPTDFPKKKRKKIIHFPT